MSTGLVRLTHARPVRAAAFLAVAEPENAVGAVEPRQLGSPDAIRAGENGLGFRQSLRMHRNCPPGGVIGSTRAALIRSPP